MLLSTFNLVVWKEKKLILTFFFTRASKSMFGSFKQFVLEHLYLGWKFASIQLKEELLKYFKEVPQFLRITEVHCIYCTQECTCRGDVSQVMQNFSTLNDNSNISWRSGGITSLDFDDVDAQGKLLKPPLYSRTISILYIGEKEKTINLWNHRFCRIPKNNFCLSGFLLMKIAWYFKKCYLCKNKIKQCWVIPSKF